MVPVALLPAGGGLVLHVSGLAAHTHDMRDDARVSVLLVEQNVERALEIAARGYVLSEGRIALDGTAPELLVNPELRRTVLGIA